MAGDSLRACGRLARLGSLAASELGRAPTGLAQLAQLGLAEASVGAGLQGAEPQRAEGDAPQREHRVADRLAHAPHLAVAAFADRDFELVPPASHAPHLRRRGGAVLQSHAGPQRAQRLLPNRPTADAHTVGAGHFVARMREPLRELAVVGEQDQAAAVGVEAPDRVEARAPRGSAPPQWDGRGCRARSRRTPTGLCTA